MPRFASTQKFVPIAEIRDNVVVMKDGSLRAVLLTSSINFALKSEMEQNAAIGSYVSFLNSLSFAVQIVIQSRRLNVDEYIERLKKVEREQTNELLRMQTREYRDYVTQLVELGQIMNKKFYVVVPFIPGTTKAKGFFSRLFETLQAATVVKLSEKKLIDRKKDLMQRVDLVATGLGNMGLNAVMLNTQNLIELYYNSYNPRTSENQKLANLEKLQVDKDMV
ncbi:MAG: hypothetical protein G01um101418_836 [Parcubacteria group bacterium Gr01-1014_18]|nr:MAG: hypothetical protein Greene041636_784 [Parcubacteria group bacterium Greene0416_36]TSC80033.1 MAG: hypothetical protein G01um101418_836 [Parcubacteria group bacterium Gr01-1014_18]TSC98099.1 MAG: hypothetical protein Greene101420_870 [Parcubacteria group bacterium Greene1014_20]TSD06615.1 MAG: hypothetical protein Greene07142_754 [Parcubacteria group bacterium Greene0714_2]